MKKYDVIFAIICGLAVAWVANDFLEIFGWVFYVCLPILFAISVDFVERVFKNIKVVGQGTRHILTGAFADIVDIKIFQLLFWIFPAQTTVKIASFLIASAIKYFGNKYWAFDKPEKAGAGKEALQFLMITLVGLLINVASFSLFTRMNPGLSLELWREVSVIFALLFTAVWNFIGYKFIVFKK